MGKVIGDFSGAMMSMYCALGDRLGLFQALAEQGPATERRARQASRSQRALRARVAARHGVGGIHRARPLPAAATACRPSTRWRSPRREAAFFFGGGYQMLPAMVGVLDQVAERFRNGGGVAQDAVRPGHVGGPRAVHQRLVREPPPTGVDSVDAGGEGEARAGLPLRGRRHRRRPGDPEARGRVPQVEVRRLRRVGGADRARSQERRGVRVRRPCAGRAEGRQRRRRREVRRDLDVRRDPRRGRSAGPVEGDPPGAEGRRHLHLPRHQLRRRSRPTTRARSRRCSTASACSTA